MRSKVGPRDENGVIDMAGLGDFPVAAVLRADDYARAAKFYTEVLGFEAVPSPGPTPQGMFRAGEGTMVMIYERPGMAAPENTTLGLGVPDDRFDAIVADLRSKGVMFEEYDMPEIGLKTVNGVAEMDGAKSAFFKDTEGNIISIATM
jgi:catechol 2,3-dioxygenase-like lactoylglutathione lyase family enzyme